MEELMELLPTAILYLASGFAFICGYYFLIDKRFDFFSEISFWILLILGFFWTNTIKSIPNIFQIKMDNVKNVVIVIGSLIIGIIIAFARNVFEKKGNNLALTLGRKKTFTDSFWYSLLDDANKPVTVRLRNEEKNIILEGVLLRISEDDDNPYLLLGYCMKYDLKGQIVDKSMAKDKNIQLIVRPENFTEISIIYAEGSSKIIELDIE